MNITSGSGEDLGIFEIQQAATYIEGIISEDATFVWGCAEDSEMEGSVEIVIIATGFDDSHSEQPTKIKQDNKRPLWHDPQPQPVEEKRETDLLPSAMEIKRGPSWLEDKKDVPLPKEVTQRDISEELDEPTFLRKSKAEDNPEIN